MRIDESHLYREITEQPIVVNRLIAESQQNIQVLSRVIINREIKHIYIAARGSSDNAGRYAQYLLGMQNQMNVTLGTPSLFSIYQKPPNLRDSLVLGISQSGKSPDLVEVLSEATRQGALTASITNDPESPMANYSQYIIPLHAGAELSLAATKTYTAELTAIAMLSNFLSNKKSIDPALSRLSGTIQSILDKQNEIKDLITRFQQMEHCVVIGRGINYSTVFEFSLKLKELTYTIAEPYSSADFLHGPIAMIQKGFPVFLIAPNGKTVEELQEFIFQITKRGGVVIGISNVDKILDNSSCKIDFPKNVPEWLSPIVSIVPAQIFAMYLSAARGIDIDHPRGLEKVTETL